MMINDSHLIDRHLYIGGSDVPIIMGTSKFKSSWDLLLSKAQLLEDDFGGNIYTYTGQVLEPRIQEHLNLVNVDEKTYEKTYNQVYFACHLDGLNVQENQVQEIKVVSQSVEKCFQVYEWQIRCYMYVTGLKSARLIVYQRESMVKSYLSYIREFYNLSHFHNFNYLNDNLQQKVKADIEYGLNKIPMEEIELKTMVINHCSEKEAQMLKQVEKFWDYKKRLEEDNELMYNEKFQEDFRKDFK